MAFRVQKSFTTENIKEPEILRRLTPQNLGSLGIHGVIPKNGRIIAENNTNFRSNFHGNNEPKL
jgi:hypothetical protein